MDVNDILINHESWHRKKIGGLWKEIGKLQFDFLKNQGLEPSHNFLDVGCGSLRGGIHFIDFLESRHYFGIDKDRELIEAGKKFELTQETLVNKKPTLVKMDDFNFSTLDKKFEFALAQSVFTHLPINNIIRCIMNIDKVLLPNGKFFVTFFENKKGKFNLEPVIHPQSDGPDQATYFDKDSFHYDFETFEWICHDISLNVSYIGNWNHPRNQKMMVFTK